MKMKLNIFFISLLILTLSISAVSASDINSNGTFTDLQNLIDSDTTGSISLDKNYAFTTSDMDYQKGVNVNKSININGNGFSINGNNEARIFNVTADNVVLSNINFINGYTEENGGAIIINGVNCSINKCYFTSNNADKGGSIFIAANGCTVTNSLFEDNIATYGTIYCQGNDSTVYNSNFVNNYMKQCGAGLWINASNFKVFNSNFIKGATLYTGGGITFSAGDKLLIDNCSFIDGCAISYGGALLLRGSNTLVTHCVFYNNSAKLGGAIQSSGLNTTIKNSIFDGNHAINGQSVAYKNNTNFIGNDNYWAMNFNSKEEFINSDLLSYYYKLDGVHTDVSTAPDNWILMKINPITDVVANQIAYFKVSFDTFNGYTAILPDYKTIISYGDESLELTIPRGRDAIFNLTFSEAGEYMISAYSPISGMIEAELSVNVTDSGNGSSNSSSNLSNESTINTLPNAGNPLLALLLALLAFPLIRRRL